MKQKQFLPIVVSLLCTLFALTSCEQTKLPLDEPNVIKRLESFHGEDVKAVSRQLKGDGFYDLSFGQATSFSKGTEQYTLNHNTIDKRTINSAVYIRSFEATKDMQEKYAEWKKLVVDNGVVNMKYRGQILATNFVDLDENYVAVDTINDTTFTFMYDEEVYLNQAYEVNKASTTFLSELWYEGERNEGREFSVQMSTMPRYPSSKIIGNTGIMNSDFSIK